MEKYDENTSKIQTKSLEIVNLTEQKDAPISIVSSPDTTQWEKNFSNRWATKQYTKKEIICALNDVKQTQVVVSSNVASLTSRLTKVEENLNDLIIYINQRIP